jgi:hypothetical protein
LQEPLLEPAVHTAVIPEVSYILHYIGQIRRFLNHHTTGKQTLSTTQQAHGTAILHSHAPVISKMKKAK